MLINCRFNSKYWIFNWIFEYFRALKVFNTNMKCRMMTRLLQPNKMENFTTFKNEEHPNYVHMYTRVCVVHRWLDHSIQFSMYIIVWCVWTHFLVPKHKNRLFAYSFRLKFCWNVCRNDSTFVKRTQMFTQIHCAFWKKPNDYTK